MLKTSRIISISDNLHHCSSITAIDDYFVLCFYEGSECTNDQKVVIILYDNNFKELDRLIKPNRTGNPIIWNEDGRLMMIYSYFSDTDENGNLVKIRQPVKRWMYCDNYLSELKINNDSLECIKDDLIYDMHGQLTRCSPIKLNDKTLIPTYREKNPKCFIWEYDNNELSCLSSFGDLDISRMPNLSYSYLGKGVAIQPSLVYCNNRLYAFCRNVCRSSDNNKYSWQAYSEDYGKSWSNLDIGIIPNHNNSIVVIPSINKNSVIFLFNNNRQRKDLIMHETASSCSMNLSIPLGPIRSFSYPNYCWDKHGSLHLVHTNCRKIAWHTIDRELIHELFKTN